jgi:hypothetical protein
LRTRFLRREFIPCSKNLGNPGRPRWETLFFGMIIL